MEIILALIVGYVCTRMYYALSTTMDWMHSSDWFKGEWWAKLHKFFCWTCPKKHYCERRMNDL